MADWDPNGVQRRVVGLHDLRLDGLTDLTLRCRGASVLDLGCNRGVVCLELAYNGARLLHGCDNYLKGIETAREVFADIRMVQSRFEHCDLTHGSASLNVFGDQRYDITLLLATYHKIKRKMPADRLSGLIKEIGRRTVRYFAWRGTADQHEENIREIEAMDRDLAETGLTRIHTSYIATELGVAAIWARP
jgi:hypothetical protein